MNVENGNYKFVKRHEFNKTKSLYIIYSPQTFKLRPRDNILLDLKIKVNAPESLQAWINLLPCFKEAGFAVEDHNWAANKLKDETIQLNILNKNFYNTFTIKKDQELGYMFLLGQRFNEKSILNILLLGKITNCFLFCTPHEMDMYFFQASLLI